MGTHTSTDSQAFINTAIAISDIVNGNPGSTPLEDLVNSISDDFGVSIKWGSNWSDFMFAQRGDLSFTVGGGGHDLILGRSSTDVMFGGSGNDKLFGRAGDDALFGGSGNDRLFGGSGDDFLRGDDGCDILKGGWGNDHLEGGNGRDWLLGNKGDDYLNGGAGDDYILGGAGNDYVNQSDGDDCIHGGRGDDTLEGGAGDDYIHGGSGNDFISAAGGDDILIGGRGADTFFWEVGFGEGNDVVRDFELGTDKVLFRMQSILDSSPDVAEAMNNGASLGEALDDSTLWLISASEDGDVLISLPEFTIEFDGFAYDSSITFEMLEDMGAFDTF